MTSSIFYYFLSVKRVICNDAELLLHSYFWNRQFHTLEINDKTGAVT